TTRVSPSGRYLGFSSAVSLTGFDNAPASPDECEGNACTEIFLFDAQSMQLSCASCAAGGTRPRGETTGPGPSGFSEKAAGRPAYFARQFFDDGRMLLTTVNALTPADANDAADVY